MVTVLLTGVGGAAGIGAIRSLKETTDHELVGVDMDPEAAGLLMTDVAARVPPAAADDWVDAMAAVARRHAVDVIVPTVDEELSHLPELRSALPDVGVVAPRQDVIEVALDKYRTSRVLEAAGHAVPRTWLGTAAPEIPADAYPLIGKPRVGRGSRGVERLDSSADVDAFLAAADDPDAVVIQELIAGPEYTPRVVATSDNRLLGMVPKEAIEKQGSTVRGVTRAEPAVEESCRAVSETLEPAGPINVQQIRSDGTAYTIEINPRFSSTACLTVAAGVDELDLLIRDAAGEAVESTGEFEPGTHLIRYLDHVIVSEERLEHVADYPPAEPPR
jgi:carbamoyl-phosphate synthase large subunit